LTHTTPIEAMFQSPGYGIYLSLRSIRRKTYNLVGSRNPEYFWVLFYAPYFELVFDIPGYGMYHLEVCETKTNIVGTRCARRVLFCTPYRFSDQMFFCVPAAAVPRAATRSTHPFNRVTLYNGSIVRDAGSVLQHKRDLYRISYSIHL